MDFCIKIKDILISESFANKKVIFHRNKTTKNMIRNQNIFLKVKLIMLHEFLQCSKQNSQLLTAARKLSLICWPALERAIKRTWKGIITGLTSPYHISGEELFSVHETK